jgi:16S rRNA (guanine(966)-N(2))-methyltransferase RsmD
MRVIAGTFRSRILDEVGTDQTRETKDRVKESIFNTIQNQIHGAQVLDLFAGSGSLGIEAISRGAKNCIFVDNQKQAMETLRTNIGRLQIEHQTEIVYLDYQSFLETTYQPFQLILLDPPYHKHVLNDVLGIIADKKLLDRDGVIVCLYHKNDSINVDNNGIIEYKKKTIGITNVSFMKWGI